MKRISVIRIGLYCKIQVLFAAHFGIIFSTTGKNTVITNASALSTNANINRITIIISIVHGSRVSSTSSALLQHHPLSGGWNSWLHRLLCFSLQRSERTDAEAKRIQSIINSQDVYKLMRSHCVIYKSNKHIKNKQKWNLSTKLESISWLRKSTQQCFFWYS